MNTGSKAALAALLCAMLATAHAAKPAAERIDRIEVEGTLLRVHLADGRTLAGEALVGSTLTLVAPGARTPRQVRIEAFTTDPHDPEHETRLYRMTAVDPRTGRNEELCGPDPDGEHWAFPVQGRWDEQGNRQGTSGFTLVCGDGAIGKCVRWGYKPWKRRVDGTHLGDYHQACVRMVRADYCGGHGTTRDGMLIDVYDRLGIQQPSADAPARGLRFEAAWSPRGADCVAHTRVPEHETLRQLAADCPRLSRRLGEAACPPPHGGTVYGAGALLYNWSR